MNYPLGLQLYSLRREFANDAVAALRSVPGLGFGAIETAGSYGWSAEQWRRLMDETGLVAYGSHMGFSGLDEDLAGAVAFVKAIGASRVVVPSPGFQDHTRPNYEAAARKLNALAPRLRDEGLALLYHNHAFEFAPLPEGGTGMEILLSETDPALVGFEVDTYWVEKGGLNSRDFIASNASRIGMIHAKELRKRDGADVPAGQGDVDFRAVGDMAAKHRWPVVVEYEGENAVESCAASARYLKTLWKL